MISKRIVQILTGINHSCMEKPYKGDFNLKKWEQYGIMTAKQSPAAGQCSRLRQIRNYFIIFVFGGLYYCFLEALWRGYTHWTMAVTGGACFLGLFIISVKGRELPLLLKCFIGSALITAIELCAGSIVNLILGWNVWDYSVLRFHFMGQICLVYSLIWFFLCIPGIKLCHLLYQLLFDVSDELHIGKGSEIHETQIW